MGRELPILFNTDMVCAILDERKTATRRICRDGNDYSVPDMQFFDAEKRTYAVHNYADKEHRESVSIAERTCPVCPDDILYVRETWQYLYELDGNEQIIEGTGRYYYAATDKMPFDSYVDPHGNNRFNVPWRPSIHMPKAAARIWLHVTGVTVERLQDMSLDDFLDEGVMLRPEALNDSENAYWQARDIFRGIWDSTIPKAKQQEYGWDANPWIWAIEFDRCEKPAAGLQGTGGISWQGQK